jgi:hypothetical protein
VDDKRDDAKGVTAERRLPGRSRPNGTDVGGKDRTKTKKQRKQRAAERKAARKRTAARIQRIERVGVGGLLLAVGAVLGAVASLVVPRSGRA